MYAGIGGNSISDKMTETRVLLIATEISIQKISVPYTRLSIPLYSLMIISTLRIQRVTIGI